MTPQVIDVYPVQAENLSPAAFIELVEKSPGLIQKSTIIPPTLGSRSFGRIHVEYSRPICMSIPTFKPVAR